MAADFTGIFEQLFAGHYARVVSVLVRLTGSRARAEEIASDVFCKVAQANPGSDEIVPWIYRTASNAGLDVARSNARERKLPSVSDRVEADALQSILREERAVRVRKTLSAMKPRDAKLLLLRAEGMAYKELAETCGVVQSSVGTLLVRAEAEFAKRYKAAYGEER